jgi:hypothetical protein
MDTQNPVPDPDAHGISRYDTDPDALAWARTRVQHQIDRLAAFEARAAETGKANLAHGLSMARRSTEQLLLGGEGCVVGAFDARRPVMFGGQPAGEPTVEERAVPTPPLTAAELAGGAADVALLNAEFPDEPQDPTSASAEDTLPEWLCQRYRHYAFPTDTRTWEQLPDEDRSYWEHEAAAVRRAVTRGGFKAQAGGEQARPNPLRQLVDGVAAQLHDEDPAAYHGDGGPGDCQRCAATGGERA